MRRTTTNNATTMSAATTTNEEKTTMKKNTTAITKTTTTTKGVKEMKKATENANALTINGITISLTPEQSAAIAAMLVGGTAVEEKVEEPTTPTPKKSAAKKATEKKSHAASEHEPTPFADFAVKVEENRISFTTKDGKFLYQKAPRQALNNRLKAWCKEYNHSVSYNKEYWAWEVLTPTGRCASKTRMCTLRKMMELPVTVKEQEAVFAEWEAAKVKRAAK